MLLSILYAVFQPMAMSASQPEIYVPYFDSALFHITIDGNETDWPDSALEHGVYFYAGDGNDGSASVYGTTVLGTMSGRTDGEVSLYLAHDGQYLYILAIIQDDDLEQRIAENNTNEAWREDALHIYASSSEFMGHLRLWQMPERVK